MQGYIVMSEEEKKIAQPEPAPSQDVKAASKPRSAAGKPAEQKPAAEGASSKKSAGKTGGAKPEGKPASKAKAQGGGSADGGGGTAVPKGYVPRLKKVYAEKIAPELFKEFNYKTVMQIPRLVKIVVSMGVGAAKEDKKLLDAAIEDISLITGQRAVKTKSKKSIANFKIRAGQEIGAMVTLRGAIMYEFLDRLVNVALPRVKDFRGINPNAFDGHGNYSLGIQEQIIFPEIDFDKIVRVSGLNIAIVTTANTDAEARAFLAKFGMPFRK
jgi:large subunit ribosomal protein L5